MSPPVVEGKDGEGEAVLEAAKFMLAAARTAPKTAGVDAPSHSTTTPATPATQTHITEELINFAIDMQRNGRSEATITNRIKALKQMATLTDLHNPEQVKTMMANRQTWKPRTRRRYAETYNSLLQFLQIKWTRPHYITQDRIPFIPTEIEIDMLISSCGKHMATLLQTLKETAIRISEATMLQWTDLNTEQRTLNITPAKGSNPRILKISNRLLDMLNQHPHNNKLIFPPRIHSLRTTYCRQRKQAAQKLQNPRIKQISFHTFRHWKATMEYHKTKDIMHVKQLLGHRNINNTMIYINLEQALFTEQNDQYTCKVAHNENEAINLIETGFEYINNLGDTTALYRKRK